MSGEIVLLGPESRRANMMATASEQGADVRWVSSDDDLATVAEGCRDAVAIVTPATLFDVELARRCPRLKLLQRTGAGTDGFPVAELAEMGVVVANNGGGNSAAVAEHAIALMVGVYRKLHLQVLSVEARKWQGDVRQRWFSQAHELTGKTVGIVGGGYIGRQVAQRLRGWDCELVYYDIVAMPESEAGRLDVERLPLDELLTIADVVTLHVPHVKSTHHMIGGRELSLMKPTAILINTGRGPVVDEAALIRSLRMGKIAGVGLDVLEEEPPAADNPLLDMENAMVTPHLAGTSQEAVYKSLVFGLANAARVAAGLEPQSVVLPD